MDHNNNYDITFYSSWLDDNDTWLDQILNENSEENQSITIHADAVSQSEVNDHLQFNQAPEPAALINYQFGEPQNHNQDVRPQQHHQIGESQHHCQMNAYNDPVNTINYAFSSDLIQVPSENIAALRCLPEVTPEFEREYIVLSPPPQPIPIVTGNRSGYAHAIHHVTDVMLAPQLPGHYEEDMLPTTQAITGANQATDAEPLPSTSSWLSSTSGLLYTSGLPSTAWLPSTSGLPSASGLPSTSGLTSTSWLPSIPSVGSAFTRVMPTQTENQPLDLSGPPVPVDAHAVVDARSTDDAYYIAELEMNAVLTLTQLKQKKLNKQL